MKRIIAAVLLLVLLLPFFALAEQPPLPEPYAEAMQKFFDNLKDSRIIVSKTDYTLETTEHGTR